MSMVLWALVGCELFETQWEPVSYVDEGAVCLEASGSDVTVTVTAPDCLSSSCSRDLGGSCEAVVDGSTITVTSEITWEEAVAGSNLDCTDDCGAPRVTCTIEGGLADGPYTVEIGGEATSIEFPANACDLGYF
ncbi:MAG: hypothetical protein AAGA48_41270 [Myxococcota bacterium]